VNRAAKVVLAALLACPWPAAGGGDETASVAGRVLDAATGKPLTKARIDLEEVVHVRSLEDYQRRRRYSTRTGADGRFELSEIPPGRYELTASRPGYVPQDWTGKTVWVAGAVVTLRPGERREKVIFRLQRAAAVTGRVTDPDGEPVPEAPLTLFAVSWARGRPLFLPHRSAETDDRGLYRLFHVMPGRYYLGLEVGRDSDTPSVRFWPGTLDPEQAEPIVLKPGDEIPGIDMVYHAPPAAVVSGKVTGPDGAPVRDAFVGVVPAVEGPPPSPGFERADPETGEFELHALSGSVILTARTFNREPELLGRMLLEIPEAGLRDIVVRLHAGTVVKGRVRTAGELPASLRLGLVPTWSWPQIYRSATVGSDGSFLLRDIFPGRYYLETPDLPKRAYVAAVWAGKEPVGEVLEVGPDGAPGELQVEIRWDSRSVRGVVRDREGNPLPGATVVALPPRGRWRWWSRYRTGRTDQNGSFLIKHVPPDSFLVAVEHLEPGAWEAPWFAPRYVPYAEPLDDPEAEVELIALPAPE